MSALLPSANGALTIAGEGGHVTMTPATAEESAILDLMRKRYDHVSAERLLSGPGLVNLYNARCELAGTPAASYPGRTDHQSFDLEGRPADARGDRDVLRDARDREPAISR